MSLSVSHDAEVNAISALVDHLEPLDDVARGRVLRYLTARYAPLAMVPALPLAGVKPVTRTLDVLGSLDVALTNREITAATHRTILERAGVRPQ
jgi:hypothetical protein